jgi:hypothetical protein
MPIVPVVPSTRIHSCSLLYLRSDGKFIMILFCPKLNETTDFATLFLIMAIFAWDVFADH